LVILLQNKKGINKKMSQRINSEMVYSHHEYQASNDTVKEIAEDMKGHTWHHHFHIIGPLLEIIKQMRIDVYGKLDPAVVTVLINNISNKFVGKKVLLSDGRKGSIVYINPYEQPKPLIQVNTNYFIDLSKQRKLRIAEIVF